MFGMFGTAAKKTAQALDLIEEDQPELVEEVPETIGDLIKQQLNETMIKPKKVGLVEPIIIDPQVIFERLTELFGVYKGTKTVHSMECTDCGHGWEEEHSPAIDWDEAFIECPDCGCEDTFFDSHNRKSTRRSTSRTPTQEELSFVTGRELHWHWQVEVVKEDLQLLFAALTGNVPVDEDGDDVDEGYIIATLLEYRDIKSLSEMNQIDGLDSDGVVFDEGFDGV